MHVLNDEHRLPAHMIYSDSVYSRGKSGLGHELWGNIPHSLGEAAEILTRIRSEYTECMYLEPLKRVMKNNLRRMGVLTGKTSMAIDSLHDGVVEAGQQPMLLGGPGLILNKIAYAVSLAGEAGVVPLY